MRRKSLPIQTLMIAASTSLIMLACQTLSSSTKTPNAALTPHINQPAAPSPTSQLQTETTPSPSPTTTEQSGGNELPNTLVYLLEDHSLVFLKSDGASMSASMGGEFASWYDLNDAAERMTIIKNAVFVPILNPEQAIRGELGILYINADGAEQFFTAPAEYAAEASIVDVLPSPDGEWFAWLLDTTKIPPSLASDQVCDDSAGCVGREYILLVTSRNGSEIMMEHPLVVGDPYPFLLFDSWKEDSSAIFLRRVPWMVLSPIYQVEGGGTYEISIPAGNLVERSDKFLNSETHASSDGFWIVEEAIGEGEFILIATSWVGAIHAVQAPTVGHHLTQESTFSPTSDYLVWLELDVNIEDWSSVEAIEIRLMDLSNGETKTLSKIDGPIPSEDLPFIGHWLSGTLLVIHQINQSQALNIITGDWIPIPAPQTSSSWVVVGGMKE